MARLRIFRKQRKRRKRRQDPLDIFRLPRGTSRWGRSGSGKFSDQVQAALYWARKRRRDTGEVGPDTPPTIISNPFLIGDFFYDPDAPKMVSTTNGNWDATPPVPGGGYSYQWFRAPSTPIPGATFQNYTIQVADVGQQLFCRVTADNGVPPPGVADSNTSSVVIDATNFRITGDGDYRIIGAGDHRSIGS